MKSRVRRLFRILRQNSIYDYILQDFGGEKPVRKRHNGRFLKLFSYAMISAICIWIVTGLHKVDHLGDVPELCVIWLCFLGILFGFLGGLWHLFHMGDYETLFSLPVTVEELYGAKLVLMFSRTITFTAVSSVSVLASYAYWMKPPVMVWPCWILSTFLVLAIAEGMGTAAGMLIRRLDLQFHFRTVLLVVVLICGFFVSFASGQIYDALFGNREKATATMERLVRIIFAAGEVMPPIRWFLGVVEGHRFLPLLYLVLTACAVCLLLFFLGRRPYRSLNSRNTNYFFGKYHGTNKSKKDIVSAIARKEAKEFFRSVLCVFQYCAGSAFAIFVSAAFMNEGADRFLGLFLKDPMMGKRLLRPVVPLLLFLLICGRAATTGIYSLEGKKHWILQTMPLRREDICRGKMRFQLWITVPVMLFCCLCFSITLRLPVQDYILYLAEGFCLCLFSASYGMFCGIRHLHLYWRKEGEIVNNGPALTAYVFPVLAGTAVLIVISEFLARFVDPSVVLLADGGIALALSAFFYQKLRRLPFIEKTRQKPLHT